MPFVSVSARRSWQTRPHRGGRGSRRRRVARACHDAGHGARRRALEVLGGGRPAPAGPARRGRPAGAGGPHEPGERRRGPLDERGGAAPGGRGAQRAAQPRRAAARGARASAAQPAADPARRRGAHVASSASAPSALIILSIIGLSVGLGFFNEYRSERAVEALHSQLRHTALVAARRRGRARSTSTELVPGDVVRLAVGDVVPADLRLLRGRGPRVRRGGADRRGRCRRRSSVDADRGAGVAAGAALVRVHGHRRARWQRPGRRRPDRGPTEFGAIATAARRAPAARRRSSAACATSRCCWCASRPCWPSSIFVINVALGRAAAGVGALRAGDRRRADAAAAAGDRDDQPLDRRAAAGRSARSSSSGWSASRTSATSTSSSPTRPAR